MRRSDPVVVPYTVPLFVSSLHPDGHDGLSWPTTRLRLRDDHPTPIQSFCLPELPEDFPLVIKRDDLTGGIEGSGNKTRKLEFLLARALEQGAQDIITVGGTQSNHVRQTAAACARLKLVSHAIVRHDSDSHNGNVLLTALLGSHVIPYEREALFDLEYKGLHRYAAAMEMEADRLRGAGRRVNIIPMGGSDACGIWGYIDWVREVDDQCKADGATLAASVGTIVGACGSAGTMGGIAIGCHQYNAGRQGEKPVQVLGYGVCDDPQYFYNEINQVIPQVYRTHATATDMLLVRNAKGNGYAVNTTEELQFIARVARETGIVLDGSYTGKAALQMWRDIRSGALRHDDRAVMFLHSGGAASIFASNFTGVL